MIEKEKTNEELNALLEEYFPKGHKHRGKAVVIVAQANIEIRKAREEVFELLMKVANENGASKQFRNTLSHISVLCRSELKGGREK